MKTRKSKSTHTLEKLSNGYILECKENKYILVREEERFFLEAVNVPKTATMQVIRAKDSGGGVVLIDFRDMLKMKNSYEYFEYSKIGQKYEQK